MKVTYCTSVPIIINFCFEIGFLLQLLRKYTTCNTFSDFKALQASSRHHNNILCFQSFPMIFPLNRNNFGSPDRSWGIIDYNQSGKLQRPAWKAVHIACDVGNRVHTRHDSDEDVRGNACNKAIAWKALPGLSLYKHSFCGKHGSSGKHRGIIS